jgi:phage FluMu gp28-like protein
MPLNSSSNSNSPSALLPYQSAVINDPSSVIVVEKSRRIGLSYCLAYLSVINACKQHGMDTIYLSYNASSCEDFIRDCKHFALIIDQEFFSQTNNTIFKESAKESIQNKTIQFSSGYSIRAMSSNETNLRSRHRNITILDEFAFHSDQKQLLKAALAGKMLGGKIIILSTHNGASNEFAKLCEDIRAKKWNYSLHRITLDDALEQGYFERIVAPLLGIKDPTPVSKSKWRNNLIADYGADADEELFAIPNSSSGQYIDRALIESRMLNGTVIRLDKDNDFALKCHQDKLKEIDKWLGSEVAPLLSNLNNDKQHFFGLDFGRNSDRTVLNIGFVGQDLTRIFPLSVELLNLPFAMQEHILESIIKRIPNLLKGACDATGNGQQVSEYLVNRFGSKIDAIHISAKTYEEGLPQFKKAIEDNKIQLIQDADHLNDLSMFKNDQGRPTLRAAKNKSVEKGKPNRHADAAIAYLLGYLASLQQSAKIEFQSVNTSRFTKLTYEDDLPSNSRWSNL